MTIRKTPSGYRVTSKRGKPMGTYATKREADKRLKQIEYHKTRKKAYGKA